MGIRIARAWHGGFSAFGVYILFFLFGLVSHLVGGFVEKAL